MLPDELTQALHLRNHHTEDYTEEVAPELAQAETEAQDHVPVTTTTEKNDIPSQLLFGPEEKVEKAASPIPGCSCCIRRPLAFFEEYDLG